jgi:hypothetical protein
MSINALRLRLKLDIPACAIAGCEEPPCDSPPQDMQVAHVFFCRAHADQLASVISDRNYQDLLGWLNNHGISGEPVLVDTEDESFADIYKRKCGIPACDKNGDRSAIAFEPLRALDVRTGWAWKRYVWLCGDHAPAAQHVIDRLNGPRVLRELEHKTSPIARVKETQPALSRTDQELYRNLGHEQIATRTNQELWKMNRSRLSLRRKGYNAFRAQVNRIRSSYHLPSSKSLAKSPKSDQSRIPDRSAATNK